MDEGLPVAYTVLERGIGVFASGGEQVGTVHHVVAAPEKDIFHGIVIATPGHGKRFVEAADIEALHERGVDLRIDATQSRALPQPGGGAPMFTEDPAAPGGWGHWVERRLLGRGDWHRSR
ncbi:MAG TPA: hypothetical protein VMA83_00780 [Solirubrobacteraceae bacterium]|nr:hypothetical protein [Solirubrobacteraceae bacterium]